MRGSNQKRLPADGDLLLLETATDELSRNRSAAAEVDKVQRKSVLPLCPPPPWGSLSTVSIAAESHGVPEWGMDGVLQGRRDPRRCRKPTASWGGDFPGDSDAEESACSAGDPGLIPGLGRSPGEGNGYPLQYSGLENSTDRGAWWATVHESQSVRHD